MKCFVTFFIETREMFRTIVLFETCELLNNPTKVACIYVQLSAIQIIHVVEKTLGSHTSNNAAV